MRPATWLTLPTVLLLLLAAAPDRAMADVAEDLAEAQSEADDALRRAALLRVFAGGEGARATLAQAMRGKAAMRLAPLFVHMPSERGADVLFAALDAKDEEVRVALIRALAENYGQRGRIAIDFQTRIRKASDEVAREMLRAGVHLRCRESREWLVQEALGERLEVLGTVFDPNHRTDVLGSLVRHIPDSRPALVRLTGEDFGVDNRSWYEWIRTRPAVEKAREGGVPKREMKPDGVPEGRDFFGATIPVTNVVLLLDASKSMDKPVPGCEQTLFDRVRERAIAFIDSWPPQERFNVIFFNSGVQAFRKELVRASTGNREGAVLFIKRRKVRGGTNLEAGLRAALRDERVRHVVLLSDGLPTQGGVRKVKDVLKLLGQRKVKIHTVGTNASSAFLNELALRTGGTRGSL